MSTPVLILGSSGSGKSTSLSKLNPNDCLLIQAIRKPLPFRSAEWKACTRENPNGSVFVTDKAASICHLIASTSKKIIIVDDFQYVMANEFMRRSAERGFDKFTEIAKAAWDIFNAASNAADDKRVYILSHTETNELGNTKIKTIGKLLDEKITLEGMVTIVLRTSRINGEYIFMTQNSGQDTVKSPVDMFKDEHIPNDLAAVDKAITEYYGIASAMSLTLQTA